MAEPNRDGCTTVQEISVAPRGQSFKESGPDHSATDHSCPIDAQCGDSDKYTDNLKWQDACGVGHGTMTKRSLDPASMNPEQLTSTPTKQDLLNEEIQKWAMRTHLEVQQLEGIRRDHVERMKFVLPDLRARESVFYWQDDPSRIQHGRKSGTWLKVEIIAIKGPVAVANTGSTGISHRLWQSFHVIFRISISCAACFFRAPSVAILTFLRPAVNLLLGCSSGKPFKTNWREGLS